MANIKLCLEYDGTNYHGWQRQPDVISIQGTIEERIKTIVQEDIVLTGAGRTDARVHALGQTANFKTRSQIAPSSLQRSLNRLLPSDIVVTDSQYVDEDFHARYSAKAKVYQYRILNRNYPTAINRDFIWNLNYNIDIRKMKIASDYLVGKHDFASFCSSIYQGKNTICHIYLLSIKKRDALILVNIRGDRFLSHMVRNIVGALIDTGRDKILPSDIKKIMKAGERKGYGIIAPPEGLFLMEVIY
ncbi:MAG: tRNA pseudouridine(38-40) synthase TruA [Nitrospirota bacterium]